MSDVRPMTEIEVKLFKEVEKLRDLLRETAFCYWCEAERTAISTDPPDELLERLSKVVPDWLERGADLAEMDSKEPERRDD